MSRPSIGAPGLPLALSLLAPLALGAAPPAASAEAVEWIVEEGSSLLLRLVMDEGRGPCGGVLTVDPSRRFIRFEGIPGDLGCRRVVEAPFSDLKSLRAQRREAGFVLEFAAKDKGPKLVLLPLPHFNWFKDQRKYRQGFREVENQIASVQGTGSGRDTDPTSFGGTAGASLEQVDLPNEVVADTQKAVDLIREAMGRTPGPAEALREVLQGRPVDATVAELLAEPGAFANEPVRVRARLMRAEGSAGLRLEEEGASVGLLAEPNAEPRLASAAAWVGQDVEIVGRLRRAGEATIGAARPEEYYVQVWDCIGPEAAAAMEGTPVTLPGLLAKMGDYDGEVVRVVGRFRGRNLFGDLPPRSQKGTGDWVIKSERAAVWITGHKPGGEGWDLNPESGTANEWVEVVGRPRVRGEVAYIQAMKIGLVAQPKGARVVPPRKLLSSTPTEPPSVVFSLPLEGEAIESNTRIVVQFDRNMDEESFKGRVRLREEAGSEIGVRLLYDESRRSLIIDPVRMPRSGGNVRVELLPGIVDVDGVPLAPRPGRTAGGEVVDVLRYGPGGD